jgi:hypothetical protein
MPATPPFGGPLLQSGLIRAHRERMVHRNDDVTRLTSVDWIVAYMDREMRQIVTAQFDISGVAWCDTGFSAGLRHGPAMVRATGGRQRSRIVTSPGHEVR